MIIFDNKVYKVNKNIKGLYSIRSLIKSNQFM